MLLKKIDQARVMMDELKRVAFMMAVLCGLAAFIQGNTCASGESWSQSESKGLGIRVTGELVEAAY